MKLKRLLIGLIASVFLLTTYTFATTVGQDTAAPANEALSIFLTGAGCIALAGIVRQTMK